MARKLILGLDLGGTKIAAGVVDSAGRLRSAVRMPTPARGVARDVSALFDAARAAVASARVPWRAIRAIGVGVPGAFDPKTSIVWAPNLSGWKSVPLCGLLRKAFRRPVFVEGDRNVQALAEVWLGNAARDLVVLTLGTGIGAGLVSNGRLITGARGVAGAAGWMAVSSDWQPRFARLGCLEALGAGPAVARLARASLGKKRNRLGPMLRASVGRTTTELVVRAARRGDRVARRIVAEVGTNLGRGVASIVSLLNPEVVVVGGGLGAAGELLLGPLRRAALRWGQPLASRQVRIVRSRLGDNAGVLGAARYALLKLEGRI